MNACSRLTWLPAGGHCSAGQSGGPLEGQVAWDEHDRLFIEDRVFRQHPVEIGAEPVSKVVGVDRSAKPARMEAASNSIAEVDPGDPGADGSDLAGAIGERYHAELGRTTTAGCVPRSGVGAVGK